MRRLSLFIIFFALGCGSESGSLIQTESADPTVSHAISDVAKLGPVNVKTIDHQGSTTETTTSTPNVNSEPTPVSIKSLDNNRPVIPMQDGLPMADALTIYDLQDRSSNNHPDENSMVTVANVIVTTGVAAISPTLSGFYVQELAGGPHSGILVVFPNGRFGDEIRPGAELHIHGKYHEWFTMAQLSGEKLDVVNYNVLPAPAKLSPAELATDKDLAEKYEGVLVEVANVEVKDYPNKYGQFQITGKLWVDDTFVKWNAVPGQKLGKVVGVMHYGYGKYRLQPRSAFDFIRCDGPGCGETAIN